MISDVYPYDTLIKPVENVPIIYATMSNDNPVMWATTIIVVSDVNYCGKSLDHSFINPIRS